MLYLKMQEEGILRGSNGMSECIVVNFRSVVGQHNGINQSESQVLVVDSN